VIRVQRLSAADGRITAVVSGHAGSAPHGEDLVCAAVSALVETWRLGFERVVAGHGGAAVDEGRAEFWWDAGSREASAVADTMMAGLADLAESFPRFVQVDDDVDR
jgi:uncharacterized protein YsxB (DUF464 family)